MTTTVVQRVDGRGNASPNKQINLNQAERYLSIASGIKLGVSGLKQLFSKPFTSMLKLGAGGYMLNRGITGHCEIYAQIGKQSNDPVNILIRSTFTVNKPREMVYVFWRKLDNLPLFMKHLDSVEMLDSTRSHWVLKLPAGVAKISWDAQIVSDIPGELIGWSSLPGSSIDNAGKVRFSDSEDGNGTIIDLIISYQPPAGGIGAGLAQILNPLFKNMVEKDVQNFKQYMDLAEMEDVVIVV